MITRALLIDTHRREVREVRDDFSGLDRLRQYVAQGGPGPKSATLDGGAVFDGEVQLFVDDEGYYRPGQAWSKIDSAPYPLAGYVVLLGRHPLGDDVEPPPWFTREYLTPLVTWLEPEQARSSARGISFTAIAPDGTRETTAYAVDWSDERPL